MRAVVSIQSSGGGGRGGASRAARYISERDRNPEREGPEPRPLFSERESDLSYRKADRYLGDGQGAPDKNDLTHFTVSFLPDEYERLGASDEERNGRLRELAREALGEIESDLGVRDLRWVAGVHRNTEHPHLHILIHKEVTDRENGEIRRLGRLPKRMLPRREIAPDGQTKIVAGGIGERFIAALDRALERTREAAMESERENSATPDAGEKAVSTEELLLQAARYNPSIAGRELTEEIILRGSHRLQDEPPEVSDLRAAFHHTSLDDPDYRTRPEQADWLGSRSKELRDLYERGATIKGDMLVIPAEEHESPDHEDKPFISSLSYALGRIRDQERAREFHTLARAIAGETADPETEIEVFRYYYSRIDENEEALGATLGEMRPLAEEMAGLETQVSVETVSRTISFEEISESDRAAGAGGYPGDEEFLEDHVHAVDSDSAELAIGEEEGSFPGEGHEAEPLTGSFNIAARKIRLSDESLRFPSGLDPETKGRIVRLTIPAIDGLIEGGRERAAIHAGIDKAVYHRDAPETDEERRRISGFLKSYVEERLKDPETRALNRSEAFRREHAHLIAARTPTELNRAAEDFLRRNLERSTTQRKPQGHSKPSTKPEERPLSVRERNLLFFGRAPEHHTAEMRDLRFAWGLSRTERAERVAALREGRLEPSSTLTQMLAELDSRRSLPALRHYQASILNAEMRNPGKIDLRGLHGRLSSYERSYLVEQIQERKGAFTKPPALVAPAAQAKEVLAPTITPAASAPLRESSSNERSRPQPPTPLTREAPDPIETQLLSRWFREMTQAHGALDSWNPKMEKETIDSEQLRDRYLLGQALETKARRELAEFKYKLALNAGETFRFVLRDPSLGSLREISEFDVRRRADARGSRGADEAQLQTGLERRVARGEIAGRDLALHTETLQEHGKILTKLIAKLEGEFHQASRNEAEAGAISQTIEQKYALRGEAPPTPLIKRETLVELQDEVISHGFVDRAHELETVRIALAAEQNQPARTDLEGSRIAAQLFTARTEFDAREERAARFERTRHLRHWEVGSEKWSLADLDRRIERETDEAKFLGRTRLHLDPGPRELAGLEAQRLAAIRETVLGRIEAEGRELRETAAEAGRMLETVSGIYERESAFRAEAGLLAPAPVFTRKELERAAANIETTRDSAMLRELADFERRFNEYGPQIDRRSPDRELGRALARETVAEVLRRESEERVHQFQTRGELQPLLLETSDGLVTKRLLGNSPQTVAERVLRPLIETQAEREQREAVREAFLQSRDHLLADREKTFAYQAAAEEIVGVLREEIKARTGAEQIESRPDLNAKEKINLEIYAEGLSDPGQREHYLRLSRGEAPPERSDHNSSSRDSGAGRSLIEMGREFFSRGAGRGR